MSEAIFRAFDDMKEKAGAIPPDACDKETGGDKWRTYGLARGEHVDFLYGYLGHGEHVGVHSHPDTTHFSCIISGSAIAWIDGVPRLLKPGDFFSVPVNAPHDFGAAGHDNCWVLDATNPPWDPNQMVFHPELQAEVDAALAALQEPSEDQ